MFVTQGGQDTRLGLVEAGMGRVSFKILSTFMHTW